MREREREREYIECFNHIFPAVPCSQKTHQNYSIKIIPLKIIFPRWKNIHLDI